MNENVAAGSVNKQLCALMFTMSALTRSRPFLIFLILPKAWQGICFIHLHVCLEMKVEKP